MEVDVDHEVRLHFGMGGDPSLPAVPIGVDCRDLGSHSSTTGIVRGVPDLVWAARLDLENELGRDGRISRQGDVGNLAPF